MRCRKMLCKRILAVQPAQAQIENAFELYCGMNQFWLVGFLCGVLVGVGIFRLEALDDCANDLCRLHHNDDCRNCAHHCHSNKNCRDGSERQIGNVDCVMHQLNGCLHQIVLAVLQRELRKVVAPNCQGNVQDEHGSEHKEQVASNAHFEFVQVAQNYHCGNQKQGKNNVHVHNRHLLAILHHILYIMLLNNWQNAFFATQKRIAFHCKRQIMPKMPTKMRGFSTFFAKTIDTLARKLYYK